MDNPEQSGEDRHLSTCRQQLLRIGETLNQYRRDHGDYPLWLSDLIPDYLDDEALLVCEGEVAENLTWLPPLYAEDPKVTTTYGYEFNTSTEWPQGALPKQLLAASYSWRDLRQMQRRYFEPWVPLVRCCRHGKELQAVNCDGELWASRLEWEYSPEAGGALLEHLQQAMTGDPYTWQETFATAEALLRNPYFGTVMDRLRSVAEEAVEAHPNNTGAYQLIGESHLADGEVEEAIAYYRWAEEQLPEDPDLPHRLGTIHKDKGQNDAAIACYRQALTLDPTRISVYSALAQCYAATDQEPQALQLRERITPHLKEDAASYTALGDIYLAGNTPDEASTAFQKALSYEEDPSPQSEISRKLAQAYGATGRWPHAALVLIGPIQTGKSTLGKLLAKALHIPQIPVDLIRFDYYKEIGFDDRIAQKAQAEKGLPGLFAYWKPFEIYAIERILQTHSNCVIDFGAGHSRYDDPDHVARAVQLLEPVDNVFLILPDPDPDESIRILNERTGGGLVSDGIDLHDHFVNHPLNATLAKFTVYTGGKTPEESRDEILDRMTPWPGLTRDRR